MVRPTTSIQVIPMNTITQQRLKHLLRYNHDTGEFTHRHSRRGVQAGRVAGSINKAGYRYIQLDGYQYLAHHLVMLYTTGTMPTHEVDHIGHDRDDNREHMLRVVTHAENHKNRSLPRNNTSGTIGVTWHKASRKWRATLKVNQRLISGGYFTTKQEAISKRQHLEQTNPFHPNHGSN